MGIIIYGRFFLFISACRTGQKIIIQVVYMLVVVEAVVDGLSSYQGGATD